MTQPKVWYSTSPVEARTAERTGLGSDLAPDSLRHWQHETLRKRVARAQTHSRFYQTRLWGIDPGRLPSLDRLPFTYPEEVAEDPLAFLCVPASEVARVTSLPTSGTSGRVKRIHFTTADLENTTDFFRIGMRTLASPDQRVLILMPGESEASIGRLLQTALAQDGIYSEIAMQSWTLLQILEAASRAQCIVGIPQEMLYLCRTQPHLRPESVLLSADYAAQSLIEILRQTWQCQVFTHYGMTETGFGCAVQCGCFEGHHVRHEDVLLEIIDPVTGLEAAPGSLGEIVLTTLSHEATALIRYRTGDMGSLVTAPCPCGGRLPRLGRVMGRRESNEILRSGQRISIHQLDEALSALPGLRSFQARLERTAESDTLHLTLDGVPSLPPADVTARLAKMASNGLNVSIQEAPVNPFANRSKKKLELTGNVEKPGIGAVVVAAGLSSRMKRFKPLLPLGNSTLIGTVVAKLLSSGVKPVLVVTGYNDTALRAGLANTQAEFIHNAAFRETDMVFSARLGLAHLQHRCEHIFFLPGDAPLFQAKSLSLLRQAMTDSILAAIPVHQGEKGHPVLLSRQAIPRLLAYQGPMGLKGALESLGDAVRLVEVDDPGCLLDADSPEDYEQLLRQAQGLREFPIRSQP